MTIRDIAIAFGYEVDKDSEQKAEASIQGLKQMATNLLGAIGIGFSFVKLNSIAEEFNGINDRLQYVTKEMGNQEDIQQQVLATANNIRGTYEDTVSTMANLIQQNKGLFDTTEKTLTFVELTSKAWKVAGRSEAEISALNDTLNTSFALGIVNASTFQTLMKKSPETIEYMEKALGKSRDELYALAQAGQLSADTLYDAFTNSADDINGTFDEMGYSISDALTNIRNQWGLFIDGLNSSLGITDTIGRVMVRAFNKVMDVLKRLQTWVERFAKAVGGTENLLKLVAIAAAAIFLALNANKIISFLQGIGKLLGGINLKILLIVAVVILIALIVEDFINFMKGNDSVIGALLEKAGIDTEKVRETIMAAWKSIKEFLGSAWETIKTKATELWGKLKDFWAENGDSVKENLLAIWYAIRDVLSAVWDALKAVAIAVFDALKAFWDRWGDKIKASFSILWDFLGSLILTFLDVIRGLAEFIAGVFSGDWNRAWEGIKTVFFGIWEAISSFIQMIWDIIWTFIGDTVENIKNKIVDTFTNIKDSITEKVTNIKEAIINGFNEAIDWIKSLPAQAVQWGKDIIMGIVDGIKGAAGALVDGVKGIGNNIKSFLGFSVPEKGPLHEYEEWMPHFMQGMAKGIEGNKPTVIDAVKSLAGEMTVLAEGAVATNRTAGTLSLGPTNKNVTQNVNIENTFNGDAAAQKNTAKAMDSAASDATSHMARGLAYAR